jgi:hypothetical protein
MKPQVLDPPKKKVIESSKLPEATRTTLQELSDTKQFEQSKQDRDVP